ncbi:hypothetical protein [uncultured Thomasclavelia sp.]|uniref:hypothetical protein n=1 Tax=uncultured Thomasclavelia sp. TaxID=3025759 RepID=UPI0026172C64|nr:hypothetical protein [uncultured Thomasclavelia sp.]
MHILRKIATRCKKCKKRDVCDHKRFVACAYMTLPASSNELTGSITVLAAAPVLRKRETRTLYLSPDDKVTIDLEDIKKELNKALSINFNRGDF